MKMQPISDMQHPSLSNVSSAEQFVIERVKRYRSIDDTELRRGLLLEVLSALAEPSNLSKICIELGDQNLYQNYAYRHNNGFIVLYVTNPDLGFQCRLHVWSVGSRVVAEKPHRHRMGFVSRVLAGELSSTIFERVAFDDGSVDASQETVFHETSINAPAHGSFDNGVAELINKGDVVLRPVSTQIYRTGETYSFAASDIHKVSTPSPLLSPNVTLTVWEPAFQESIAYEPSGTIRGSSKRLPVDRISVDEFRKLIWQIPTLIGSESPQNEEPA